MPSAATAEATSATRARRAAPATMKATARGTASGEASHLLSAGLPAVLGGASLSSVPRVECRRASSR